MCVRPVTEPIFSIPKATVSSPKYVINFETAQNTESILFVMMRMSWMNIQLLAKSRSYTNKQWNSGIYFFPTLPP